MNPLYTLCHVNNILAVPRKKQKTAIFDKLIVITEL